MLTKYGDTLTLLLSIYPNYDWLPWKFNSLPKGYWNNKENQLKFTNWISKQLNIKSIEDWYNITASVKSVCYK